MQGGKIHSEEAEAKGGGEIEKEQLVRTERSGRMQGTGPGSAEPHGPETRLRCLLLFRTPAPPRPIPASVSLASLCKLTFPALCGWKGTPHASLVFKSFYKGSAALSASLKSQFQILIGPASCQLYILDQSDVAGREGCGLVEH